ncbi:CopG family transcriptional regulator, partial [Sesbania bispinosa]
TRAHLKPKHGSKSAKVRRLICQSCLRNQPSPLAGKDPHVAHNGTKPNFSQQKEVGEGHMGFPKIRIHQCSSNIASSRYVNTWADGTKISLPVTHVANNRFTFVGNDPPDFPKYSNMDVCVGSE